MLSQAMISELLHGIWETLYMTLTSTVMAYVLGIPVGIVLYITDKNGICKNRPVNFILGVIVNVLRSVPFLILLVAILPFTRLVVGTTLGSTAAIVPLVVAAAPFVARMVESSLKEVDGGLIEAAQSMGASTMQIIMKVLLPEALPSLINGSAIAATTILGYSAMAGTIGGGGLGKIAIDYGYYRYKYLVMFAAVVLLIILVQIFQSLGTHLATKSDKRLKK